MDSLYYLRGEGRLTVTSSFLSLFFSNRYKGMAKKDAPQVGSGGASGGMSVLLSWHEKVVEVAGLGCIARTMSDWRKV